MRVTKTIREFVDHQVNLKMEQSVSLTELKRKADETEQEYMQETKSDQREYQEKLRNICSKYGINTEDIGTSYMSCPGKYYLPEVEQYQKLRQELCDKTSSLPWNSAAQKQSLWK